MKLKSKNIYINKELTIKLQEQSIFLADGTEGLHLWEASVILSRYMIKNSDLLKNKEILELGTGCGLLGMSVLLKSGCKHLTFSDNQDKVIENLQNNIMNNITFYFNDKYDILKFDWRDYKKIDKKYDVIIGAELVYQGGYIFELTKVIQKFLKEDGVCYIAMPEKRSMTYKFLEYVNENYLTYERFYFNKLNDEELFSPVINDDIKESKKLFEDLKQMNVVMYIIKHQKN